MLKLLFLICLFIPTYAQVDCAKVIRYKKGSIKKISNFNSSLKSDISCFDNTLYRGKITNIFYDDEENPTYPTRIIIQLSNLKRLSIVIDNESIEDCLSEADKRLWKDQLVKNAKVLIKAFACGASGNSDLELSSIEFVKSR